VDSSFDFILQAHSLLSIWVSEIIFYWHTGRRRAGASSEQ